MHKLIAFSLLIGILCFLVGCGGYVKTKPVLEVPIHGSVIYSDGTTLANVVVHLQPITPGSHPATLHIDAYGRFQAKVSVGQYLYYLDDSQPTEHQKLTVSCGHGHQEVRLTVAME